MSARAEFYMKAQLGMNSLLRSHSCCQDLILYGLLERGHQFFFDYLPEAALSSLPNGFLQHCCLFHQIMEAKEAMEFSSKTEVTVF